MTQFSVTGIENLETIALVQKSASDHPYIVRNETLCCNTVIVTVIVVTVIVTVIVVIVVIVVIGVIWVIWRGESRDGHCHSCDHPHLARKETLSIKYD